ncbi:hypothetical protein VARIO8X_120262 [Burkholderiales bacterium 8X]|nr:hypothetical protein VARIO8X_120262 [Burkholderiales bacterium 8X]
MARGRVRHRIAHPRQHRQGGRRHRHLGTGRPAQASGPAQVFAGRRRCGIAGIESTGLLAEPGIALIAPGQIKPAERRARD